MIKLPHVTVCGIGKETFPYRFSLSDNNRIRMHGSFHRQCRRMNTTDYDALTQFSAFISKMVRPRSSGGHGAYCNYF